MNFEISHFYDVVILEGGFRYFIREINIQKLIFVSVVAIFSSILGTKMDQSLIGICTTYAHYLDVASSHS